MPFKTHLFAQHDMADTSLNEGYKLVEYMRMSLCSAGKQNVNPKILHVPYNRH